jgi:SNF2 family DNA or RNA helicase
VKYPPFSWLRLSDEIRQSPSRIWFSFNKLPKMHETCHVRVHIGGGNTSLGDPYDAVSNHNLILAREQKVLELFLKIAKPQKAKAEFTLDHTSFGSLLPYCSVIPFEIIGTGVISPAPQHAVIKALLKDAETKDVGIEFLLLNSNQEEIKEPLFFGDVNAYVIDENLKLYLITPNVTQNEAHSILNSSRLPLLGLCQKESRQMFYTLSRLGIDFSCLNEVSLQPQCSQIVLRLLLTIDDLSKKMCARAHLVTEITDGDFFDEVEIKSTGSIPNIHILAPADLDEERYVDNVQIPTLLKRPSEEEKAARHFLYHLGAGPARLHDGFELTGDDALELLKSISQKDRMPSFIKLDDNARPTIIELTEKATLHIKASESKPKRVEVAMGLSDEFDKTGTKFSVLTQAKDSIIVLDQDTLVVINPEIQAKVRYFSDMLGLEAPLVYKNKSVAQVALLLNSFKDHLTIEAEPNLQSFLENFSIKEDEADRILPQGLMTTLRPYQHDAVAWLSALNRSGLGGLLGDEMGLGKTLMVLTHLARLKETGQSKKPALVVCPTSVIDVWKEEARIHLPHLKVMKWHGPERSLDEKITDADIVITSYAILRRDFDTKLKPLSFSTLVLDEAQYVRNQQTDSFKSAKAIKCDHRIALTGTPIENHLTDLYNILDCVEDGILGSKSSFEKQFVTPLEAGISKSALNLKILIAPIVTRRRKAEVESELPPKIENIVHCPMSQKQRELYSKYIRSMSGTILANMSADAPPRGETHFSLLSALTRLRQICCHPSLIMGDDEEYSSGKLDTLKEIMAECLEMGRKMIIYSQFLKMQEHIVNLAQELHPQGALWLHGSTMNRDEIVKGFQREDGPRIIVVSLKAGGTGITLTAADTVIFADPWWNPAVEDQAVDRAHRIGQKKTVHVIRVIADNSIECEVVALAQKKRQAAMSVLHEGFKTSANLTKDEVRGLLLREIDRVKPAEDEIVDYD